MNEIERNYLAMFDELNVIARQIDIETATVDAAQKRVNQLLEDAYLLGFFDVGFELDDDPGRVADRAKMSKILTFQIDGQDTDDRIAECVIDRDEERLKTVLATEWHRAYSWGGFDRAEEVRKSEDARVFKKWRTEQDPRVRDTHSYLEGIEVPSESFFITSDGDAALAPSGFSKPENNINCRCWLVYRIE